YSEDGQSVTLELWDNGAGCEMESQGIFYLHFPDGFRHRYGLKMNVWARKNTAILSLRKKKKSLYIPGYIKSGKIILKPQRPEVQEEAEVKLEDFSRLTSGGSFTVSGAPPNGNHTLMLPPKHIQLTWTAPGNVLDKGKGNFDYIF
uniref:Uncharacterized protein n=1 Tax=Nannospalax galili TaxID=1026970 RepID=A0A8C6RVW1_NANGA